MGTSGTERGCPWSFVPFLLYLKKCVGSMRNPGPCQPNRHEWFLKHMPLPIGVHIHLRWCPSTSNNLLFVPVRSGRSVLPNKKKACNTSSSSSYINCFSRAALNLFVSHNQSTPIHGANNIPFGSFQCSLGGVQTHPEFS